MLERWLDLTNDKKHISDLHLRLWRKISGSSCIYNFIFTSLMLE